MLDHLLDQVAAALRRQDEMVTTLRPRILDQLGELFQGMIRRGIGHLSLQVADEDGIRRYHFSAVPVERFESLYRVRVGKTPSLVPPLIAAEIFAEASPTLRGCVKPLETDDVAELYTFLADFRNPEAHARVEVTADAVAVLLKPRAH
jgi:hypothetical protein